MKKFFHISLATLVAGSALALPIDWHGEIQFDTNSISDFRRIESTTDNSGADGSQELSLANGNQANASFQSYIFRLRPEIIINDSTTVVAEITTGSANGGTFGDSTTKRDGDPRLSSGLYTFDTVRSNNLNLTQAYATFYADTATYKVGRQTFDWGLGAIYDNGEEQFSRHSTIRDGLTADFKIGNFNIDLYYSKIQATDSLTKSARIRETGASVLYDNLDREFAFGILYSSNSASNFAQLQSDQTGSIMGKTDVKITDIYLRKSWGNFKTEVEFPLINGEVGDVFTAGVNAKIKSKAVLVHNTYKFNERHTFKFNGGMVSGDDGIESSFNALYLHPNYQIANLLFRYNLNAISDSNQNVWDSYVTNTTFFKLSHEYSGAGWSWTNSVIYAIANETAKAGESAFNHNNGKRFTANFDQEDDLGIEIDSNFSYDWNTSVNFGLNVGYLLTGEYFGYNNTATPNSAKDSYVLQAFANIKF